MMERDWSPDDNDIKTVLEAHGLIPEGALFDDAVGIAKLYADRIRQRLLEFPASVDKRKALLAILEEGLMQEGLIPNNQERLFKA
ncbi:MAG TPA: hypothetical protein VEI96_03345 [Thermodesulfovibrionales bacterium]|nr:hypothetical protein [Thermodesulfovibrionales bacterium]